MNYREFPLPLSEYRKLSEFYLDLNLVFYFANHIRRTGYIPYNIYGPRFISFETGVLDYVQITLKRLRRVKDESIDNL
jgi:hypothetical protein